MAEFELTTVLDASVDRVWETLQTPATLAFVSKGKLEFRPVDPPDLPDRWTPGDYRVRMLAYGWLPVGQQVIGFELPQTDPPVRALRDNGHGTLVRVWDHWILLEPEGPTRTRYTDRVRIEAGWLTPLITPWARGFYRHRQRRWHRLVAEDFDPIERPGRDRDGQTDR